MTNTRQRIAAKPTHQEFEFDYGHNVVYFKGDAIHLTPHEADLLHVLLTNRARTTPVDTLIQKIYGASEPQNAAVSIRVAIHTLRKKLRDTGITIKAEPRVGYEIDAEALPEVNRGLSDKILVAINMARGAGEHEIAARLQAAYDLAEAHRRKWHAARGSTAPGFLKPAEPDARAQNLLRPAA